MARMALVSVTRLRVRHWWFLPQFFLASFRAAQQATASEGNLHAALLRDRNRVFWTATSWTSEAAMRAFMLAPPHGPIMRKLLGWCDEASLVHWTQDSEELPSWDTAHARLTAEGRPSKVNHPTAAHRALTFPAPKTGGSAATRLK